MSEIGKWTATHRFARISPRKARRVINLIRGMPCDAAMEQLRFNNLRAAGMVRDVLKSAMTNADEQEASMGDLYIVDARVDGGPYHLRWRPKDRGRVHPIEKRTSHIVVTVAQR